MRPRQGTEDTGTGGGGQCLLYRRYTARWRWCTACCTQRASTHTGGLEHTDACGLEAWKPCVTTKRIKGTVPLRPAAHRRMRIKGTVPLRPATHRRMGIKGTVPLRPATHRRMGVKGTVPLLLVEHSGPQPRPYCPQP